MFRVEFGMDYNVWNLQNFEFFITDKNYYYKSKLKLKLCKNVQQNERIAKN